MPDASSLLGSLLSSVSEMIKVLGHFSYSLSITPFYSLSNISTSVLFFRQATCAIVPANESLCCWLAIG